MIKPKLHNYRSLLIRMWSLSGSKNGAYIFLKKVIWNFNMIFKWTLRLHLSPIYLRTYYLKNKSIIKYIVSELKLVSIHLLYYMAFFEV